jgi:hypothetical protein
MRRREFLGGLLAATAANTLGAHGADRVYRLATKGSA